MWLNNAKSVEHVSKIHLKTMIARHLLLTSSEVMKRLEAQEQDKVLCKTNACTKVTNSLKAKLQEAKKVNRLKPRIKSMNA